MTANVYPADSGSMKRFLCRLDSEGNCLFSKDSKEQAGRDVSLCGLTVDGQGRLYLFLDNGEILLYTSDGDYHGSISLPSSENQASARIIGVCDGADGKFYVCISRGSDRCSLMEIDFENARLLEAAGHLPNINGLCIGIRRGSDFAGRGSDSAGGSDDFDNTSRQVSTIKKDISS